jgi:transcriptional regulator with XRE-family HTH domain
MTSRDNRMDRADRAAGRMIATAGREIREARIAAGISQGVVGRGAGISHAQVSRVERGLVRSTSVSVLARLSEAVGLELSIRTYPGGDPIRDAGHIRLLDRFRRSLHSSLRWRTEVPMPQAGDRRAWDAVISGSGWSVAVEAETRLSDVQARTRRLELKRRDGGIDRLILLLADTRANRSALSIARPGLAEVFPGTQAAILAALARGEEPSAGGILIL